MADSTYVVKLNNREIVDATARKSINDLADVASTGSFTDLDDVPTVSTSADGLMTSTDKKKLDSLSTLRIKDDNNGDLSFVDADGNSIPLFSAS